jgi:hypothetical protein
MKIIFSNLIIILILLVIGKGSQACEPEIYFLFKDEAREKLTSLDQDSTGDVFQRVILLHNLAFHKDKKARKQAEELLKLIKPDSARMNLVRAFKGSLKMIKVSHSKTSSKIIKTLNPIGKSPKDDARSGFAMISDAVKAESKNKIIRCIRATAACESAEHIPELFEYARVDLIWLDSFTNDQDTVANFFINLNWAKYYFKLSKKEKKAEYLTKANMFCNKALEFACTPVYVQWANEWRQRISPSIKENK